MAKVAIPGTLDQIQKEGSAIGLSHRAPPIERHIAP